MVELKAVSYRYPGSPRAAVDCLDMEIPPGEITALMGANGSGKSTIARLLTGLLPPQSGEICVNGACPDQGPSTLENLIGLVRQDPREQLIATIVDEEVAFGPEYLLLPREEIEKRVSEALASVGLSEEFNRSPETLSAGQQQRLAIAGILAMRPDYLIFDEAASMLDPAGREDYYNLCRRLTEEGYGILTITHFAEEALRADRLTVLGEGRIIARGRPAEIITRFPDLGQPYTFVLAETLRNSGILVAESAVTPEKLAAELLPLLQGAGR